MPGMQTFDPNEFFVNLYAVPMTQFAKGTYVEITYDSDAFIDEVGANGNVVRILSTDYRATMKFTLMSESPSNDVLSTALQIDRLTGSNTTQALCQDGRGTSIATANQAWIKKAPDQAFSSSEATTRVWEIRCAALVATVGGRLFL